MNINEMSKNAINIVNKLYDEYDINYHDIEISVLNHLDFVQDKHMWSDIINGQRVSFITMGIGTDMMLYVENDQIALPHDIWEPDYVDLDVYLNLKKNFAGFIVNEIANNHYSSTKIGGDKCLVSNKALYTVIRRNWDKDHQWVEAYDNSGHGYILPFESFKSEFKNVK